MLNRFINNDNGYFYESCNSKFHVSMEGVIKDCNNNTIEQVDGINGHVLIAIISRKIQLPVHYFNKLNVQYIDGDTNNGHPSNTVWDFPDGGIECLRKSGFFLIPGFSRYAINKLGVLINIKSHYCLSPYKDAMGYLMYGVTPDIGKRTITGRHRLLMLAFKKFTPNVDSLDVNHINGIKGDDRLENLEWVTRKRNMQHAYENNLRKDNKPVLVKDIVSNEITEYYSIEECSRKLNLNGDTIRLRAMSKGQKLYPPQHLFKFKSEKMPWVEITDPFKVLWEGNFNRIIILTYPTGVTKRFNSIKDAAKVLNLNPGTLRWKLRRGNKSLVIDDIKVEIYNPFKSLVGVSPQANSSNCRETA
ncbi:HNH endonuclease [Endozoicomonas sp. ONNA1]|uniref:HNH endonuclease n=1 Tax=Endozoicomonas sp. ONNA1 TaxID=2828740 RepID=UPI0021484973|nr:HNH endonuclease [Endozoicomonas sp. ONNA1]